MEHIKLLQKGPLDKGYKTLIKRAAGSFYTHELIAMHLIAAVFRVYSPPVDKPIRVIDPFCGDGRLICWLLEAFARISTVRPFSLQLELWDYDEEALITAQKKVRAVLYRLGLAAELRLVSGDTFQYAPEVFDTFDVVITNPPWEILKPDRRELGQLNDRERSLYIEGMKRQDTLLTRLFPLSQPNRKFSGWGTNLARCGVDAALRLTAKQGVCGFVSPSSLLADQTSISLRKWLLTTFTLKDLAFFPAEARLFAKVDQPCITLVAVPGKARSHDAHLTVFNRDREPQTKKALQLSSQELEVNGYVISLNLEETAQRLFSKWTDLPIFRDLEGDGPDELWAGRELDETGHAKYLAKGGDYLFVKGRMIRRFGIIEEPTWYITREGPRIPRSADFHRLVWRDVSRPTQKRRIHATIIPPGQVTGNSLNVAYYRDDDLTRLKALLGIVNSLVFEFQVRANLATGHISLGAVRKARVPPLDDSATVRELASLVDQCLDKPTDLQPELETRVARLYGLSQEEFGILVSSFDKIEPNEKERLLAPEFWERKLETPSNESLTVSIARQASAVRIPNHYTPSLSELDLCMVRAVPPGGNWKDIPDSIPSQRLAQIREGYANGEGSRSTYYGRLHPDAPSYTISTYFNRPGNGCHIHYDFEGGQHRVISQREAARLQSFPDNFVFYGNRGSVNKQIGNAVPPLLAYQLGLQVAESLSEPGQFVDLFAGAGGLSLGFRWAGWGHLVANDTDEGFLQTYAANIHPAVVPGDIRKPEVFEKVVGVVKETRSLRRHLFVIGGPPCQGFSTAGNRRSMEDERNLLFEKYAQVLATLKPDGYLFENVTGILNMEKGHVFRMIRQKLASQGYTTTVWKLGAEEYGVPQRRARVFIVGLRPDLPNCLPPLAITSMSRGDSLFQLPLAVTVREALDDLPPLSPGEDGSGKDYLGPPRNPYQSFMRGALTAADLVNRLKQR